MLSAAAAAVCIFCYIQQKRLIVASCSSSFFCRRDVLFAVYIARERVFSLSLVITKRGYYGQSEKGRTSALANKALLTALLYIMRYTAVFSCLRPFSTERLYCGGEISEHLRIWRIGMAFRWVFECLARFRAVFVYNVIILLSLLSNQSENKYMYIYENFEKRSPLCP